MIIYRRETNISRPIWCPRRWSPQRQIPHPTLGWVPRKTVSSLSVVVSAFERNRRRKVDRLPPVFTFSTKISTSKPRSQPRGNPINTDIDPRKAFWRRCDTVPRFAFVRKTPSSSNKNHLHLRLLYLSLPHLWYPHLPQPVDRKKLEPRYSQRPHQRKREVVSSSWRRPPRSPRHRMDRLVKLPLLLLSRPNQRVRRCCDGHRVWKTWYTSLNPHPPPASRNEWRSMRIPFSCLQPSPIRMTRWRDQRAILNCLSTISHIERQRSTQQRSQKQLTFRIFYVM